MFTNLINVLDGSYNKDKNDCDLSLICFGMS